MNRIAWIDTEPPEDRRDEMGDIYARLGCPRDGDGMDHVLKIHAQMPPTMEQHLALYRGIMRDPGPLSRTEREIVGVIVSARNGCLY